MITKTTFLPVKEYISRLLQVSGQQRFGGMLVIGLFLSMATSAHAADLQVRALLQGAYSSDDSSMRDDLRLAELLPAAQPYNSAAFNYSGAETVSDAVLLTSGDNAPVDWVLLELRDATNSGERVAAKAVILQADGDLADPQTGDSALSFAGIEAGDYYVALRHRNHLGVMTASPLALSDSAVSVDFTSLDTPVSGNNSRYVADDLAFLWGGDADSGGTLISSGPANDINVVRNLVLLAEGNAGFNSNFVVSAYASADFNLDGQVIASGPGNDSNLTISNVLLHPENTSLASNYIVSGQLPTVTQDDLADLTDADFEATDWTDATHSKDVDPNYTEVFDDTAVRRLDFVVTAERWQSMLDDMTANYGEFGDSQTTGGGGPGGAGGPPGGGAGGGAVAGGGDLLVVEEDPIFVPAEVYYKNKQWYRVGIRFKGNSTLQSPWQSGNLKLSFKMDFDEYEDDYPQINNQRFYGFKKFSLKNNYNDSSFLREKVAADIFRDAGLASSHAGFYTLYIDHGNGSEYFGLYTLVEEVDGEVLDTQFSSDEGNLYKPEDGSANFVAGTFNEADFEKKTNEDAADWSDIIALFAALHDDDARANAPATWRTNLEAVFDVDGFLKYLAVNGTIQNWDTYGRMIHNYYRNYSA